MAGPSNIKQYNDWITQIRDAGGVSDDGSEVMDAMRAATDLGWIVFEKSNHGPRNEMTQLGIKYLAAYLVSCAKHDTGNVWPIVTSGKDLRDAFKAEAARNTGVIHDILEEASLVPVDLVWSAMIAAGVRLQIDPTGRGKGVGWI